MDLVNKYNIGFGETFNSKSLSFWTCRVVLEEWSYINNSTFPLDSSKISDNQKFWVTKERRDDFDESLLGSVRRGIMPKLPGLCV